MFNGLYAQFQVNLHANLSKLAFIQLKIPEFATEYKLSYTYLRTRRTHKGSLETTRTVSLKGQTGYVR